MRQRAIGPAWVSASETAAKNLSNTSVQIKSMGAAGAEELDAALRKFGVRVVDHSGRSDGRSGGRLSRWPTCRSQPSAADATAGLAAGATLRYFSADRSDFQPRKERLLDLPRRSHEMESPDQGISRPDQCALRGSVTARQRFARAERDRACGDRDRQGHCQRFSHRPAPPCRQPRLVEFDGRPAPCSGPAAVPLLRQQASAGPGSSPAADQAPSSAARP